LNKLTLTLAVLAIGIPIPVFGWISIPASAGITDFGRSFVDGLSQGVRHVTISVSRPVFPAEEAVEGLDKHRTEINKPMANSKKLFSTLSPGFLSQKTRSSLTEKPKT